MNAPPSEDPFADIAPVDAKPPPDMMLNPAEIAVPHTEAEKPVSADDIVNMFKAPSEPSAPVTLAQPAATADVAKGGIVDATPTATDLSCLDQAVPADKK